MKAINIEVGKQYIAKVSNKLVPVRVDDIVVSCCTAGPGRLVHKTRYLVTNLATGRKTTFRSAAKFRSPVTEVV